MDARQTVNQWLATYGGTQGSRLSLSQQGTAAWTYQDGLSLAVELAPAANDLSIRAVVSPPLAERTDGVYTRLLAAHCMGKETDGASFCIDPQTWEVLLCRLVPLSGHSLQDLILLLDGFLTAARLWRRRMTSPEEASACDADKQDSSPTVQPSGVPGYGIMV